MFDYETINLTPEQIETRRNLLNQAGFQAYISPILLLITIFVFRHLLNQTSRPKGKYVGSSRKPSFFTLVIRRSNWILNNTYISEFGPLQVQILGFVYTGWLYYLTFSNTGRDYMHLTKAFGHVAVSQLPLHYLLAVKSPNSPMTVATGLTHERLNAYHRMFGRIIHLMLATHAVMYIGFFQKKGLLEKRIRDWDVRLGLMAFWSFNILALLAMPTIRRKAYNSLFYRSHVFLSLLLVVIVWFHVPYTRLYVAQALFFWMVNGISRSNNSQKVSVACESISADFLLVRTRAKEAQLAGVEPGMHVYLRQGSFGPRTPFTILNLQDSKEQGCIELELLAKDSGGPMTGKLSNVNISKRDLDMSLEGPYGESKEYMPTLLESNLTSTNVLLVSGGVGASYIIPIYKSLVTVRGSSSGIKLILVFRSAQHAKWAVQYLRQKSIITNAEVYISREEVERITEFETGNSGVTVTYSRPNLQQIVDDVFSTKLNTNTNTETPDPRRRNWDTVTVMSCGPSTLSQDLRKAVGKHVIDHGRDVRWYEEQFGFGG